MLRSISRTFSQRLYLRIWLAVVGGVAVLTLVVGWAWRTAAEQNALRIAPPAREVVLRDLIPHGDDTPITAPLIQSETAAYFSISTDDLCGASRTQSVVMARQMAMYLCRELTDLSLPKIGQSFGGRDHTTVMHANKKIHHLMSEDRKVFNQVAELTNRIKQRAAKR